MSIDTDHDMTSLTDGSASDEGQAVADAMADAKDQIM